MVGTEPSIPSSPMNFLPFISHKTYPSAGIDAIIKDFPSVVPQGRLLLERHYQAVFANVSHRKFLFP